MPLANARVTRDGNTVRTPRTLPRQPVPRTSKQQKASGKAGKRESGPEARAAAEHAWRPPVSRTGSGHRGGCHQRAASTWHCGASRVQALELLRELPTRARRGRNLLKFGVCVRGHLPYWVIVKYMITLPHPPRAGNRRLLRRCATGRCDDLVRQLRRLQRLAAISADTISAKFLTATPPIP